MVPIAIRRLLVTAAVSAAAVAITMTAPAAHALTLSNDLACEGTETMTFSPALSVAERNTSTAGSITLDDCFSPARTNSDIVSGKATFESTGAAGCAFSGSDTGTLTFTWYSGPHQSGSELGTTTVPYTLSEHPDFADGEDANQLTGSANPGTSTRLGLENMTGSYEPTAITGSCPKSGGGSIPRETADIAVDFSAGI